jgi:LysM repeat protein
MTQTFAKSALFLVASSAVALSAANASAATHHRRHHHAAAKPAAEADQGEAATYTVKSGDTLGKISTKLGVSVDELKTANHLKGTALKPGQVLKVPGAAPAKTAKAAGKGAHAAAAPAEEPAAPSTYKVKKGDTLAKIADKLGVSVAELKKANHLKGSAVKPGRVLKVPGAAAAPSGKAAREEAAAPSTYRVKKGDTLDKVARKTGVSVAELRAANGLSKKAKIHAGQTLKLSAEEAPSKHRAGHAAPAEEAYAPTESTSRAIGQVVEVEGPPRTYKVRKGDTINSAAEKLGVSVAQLKRENHLRSNHVKRGQVLRGRGEMVSAYVVGPTDTIYSISRRFDVSVERLKAANGLGHRGSIHTGQKLRLPAGYRDRGAAAGSFTPPTYQAPPGAAQPPTRPAYVPPATTTTPPAVAPTQAPMPTDAQISEMGRGKFLWPLQGQVISSFAAQPTGILHDGISIQANTGDPVRAAAAGSVVYAGDQVPGYGNLVLINHPDGWVTAYAHLSKVEVKMQQKVSQGQEIGQAGSTGGVSQPQVHFEVRYHSNPADRALPVDPRLVLPKE